MIRDSIKLLRQWPKFKNFIGQKVIICGFLSFVISLAQFAIDVMLSFALGAFFYALGFSQGGSQLFAQWLPGDLNAAIIFLIIVSTLRGLLGGLQSFVQGKGMVEFEWRQRRSVIKWGLSNRQAQLSEVANLFNDILNNSSNFVLVSLIVFSKLVIAGLILIYLLYLSLPTTLLALAVLSLLVFPYKLIDRRIHTVVQSIFKNLDIASKKLVNGVKNSLLLHIYNTYKVEEKSAQEALDVYRHQFLLQHAYSAMRGVLPSVFGVWLICFITIIMTKYNHGDFQQSLLISYFYLFLRCVQTLGETALQKTRLNLYRPRFVQLWEWWQKTQEITQVGAVSLSKKPIHFPSAIGWEVKSVTFGHDVGQVIFEGLNLTIAPKSCLVITGDSGRGKSSLLGLLLGLYAPHQGDIHIISKEVDEPLSVVKDSLLDNIGYVGPDSFLIAGSVRENILYGAGERVFTDEQINEALDLSECDFIRNLPNGLKHTMTEQGEGLSAGQKQRLMLARALLREPKVLILDEATANLDKTTELKLISTLENLKNRLTLIIVTHKEALLKIADKHLDLNEGSYT